MARSLSPSVLDVVRSDATVSSVPRWRAVRRRPRLSAAHGSRGSVCLDGLAVLGLAWAVALLLTVVALAAVTAVRPMGAWEPSAGVAAPRLASGAAALAASACPDEPAPRHPLTARDCVAGD